MNNSGNDYGGNYLMGKKDRIIFLISGIIICCKVVWLFIDQKKSVTFSRK